jgi:hypothetical protein
MHREQLFPTLMIFSDDPGSLKMLGTLLTPHCSRWQQASPAAVFESAPPDVECPFVLVTDLPGNIDPVRFFDRLHKRYPCGRIILVMDRIEPVMEISARAAGTLFIGSQDAFRTHVAQIFQSVKNRYGHFSMKG